MGLLTRLFGSQSVTAAVIAPEIDNHDAARDAAVARVSAAETEREAALEAGDNAALKLALEAKAEAERDVEIANHALLRLTVAHAERVAAEAKAALLARRNAAEKRAEKDAAVALSAYEKNAAAVAANVATFEGIEAEIETLNKELSAAGLPTIVGPAERHRATPTKYYPERREKRYVWVQTDYSGVEQDVKVFVERDGQLVPEQLGAEQVVRDVVVEHERTEYGTRLPRLSETVVLPGARPGSAPIWPAPKG